MIWLAMAIPFLGCLIMAILFTKKITWWEYLLCLIIPAMVILAAKQMSISNQMQDIEVLNFYAVRGEYYEHWDEYIHKTCSEQVSDGTDSKGQAKYKTRYYDCSYVDDHPPYWVLYDNVGNSYSIAQGSFEWLCKLYGNRMFKDMNRDYHRIDGNMYYTIFGGEFNKLVSITDRRSYENRIQCSKSIFNFKDVDTATIRKYSLFRYPDVPTFNYNPILGWKDDSASLQLARKNALYGTAKKVHMMMLVFNNQPYEAAMMQENLWKGGNKNEFILCVGVSPDSTIQWTKVISWTDVDILKVTVARRVKELKKFNPMQAVEIMSSEVYQSFVKKSFKDFSYISVEPTDSAVIAAFAIVLLLTTGWVIFSVRNEQDL